MLQSLALIFLVGLCLGSLLSKLGLPKLIGMLITGILLGPFMFNLIDVKVLSISTELRQIALIIILARAGFNLNIKALKNVGRPAFLLCFIPACFEIVGSIILAPKIFGLSRLDAAILGSVIAAVSPAVIVPRMLKLIEKGDGKKKAIPQMVMAGASVDDVFVIVLFTAFIGLAQDGEMAIVDLLVIPSAICLGILAGIITGFLLVYFFKLFKIHKVIKTVIVLATSFLFVALEQSLLGIVGFSGLLAVMALGATVQQRDTQEAQSLSNHFTSLWVAFELILFVLVGATLNLADALNSIYLAILFIAAVMLFRFIGVFTSLIKTNLTKKERLFVAFSYMPKATVQAAIGGLPLALGLSCGNIVASVSVVSIIVTAPIGAFLIDKTYPYLLSSDS